METSQQQNARSAAKSSEYHDEREMNSFWSEVAPRREPMQRKWFLPVILVLLVLSVPWYLPTGLIGKLIFGLPIWVWTALICSASISVLTCYVALRSWDDEEFDLSEERPSEPPKD